MSENPLRQVHRAYVEAGLMPLSDYVAEYGDSAVKPLPNWAGARHHVEANSDFVAAVQVQSELAPNDKWAHGTTCKPATKPMWENCVNAPPIPEGFKQVMRQLGIDATGVVIHNQTTFSVFDKHGTERKFILASVIY